ncbi:MAG: Lrp/AsnC family transcriptional regulator [Acidobacteria bacterium]|nr:MAG: Lrp/AsnC family transcriptional regulator [Acidobacteriota bacterium]
MKPAATDTQDAIQAELLNAIQWDFPLSETPFADLGERLEVSETEVIDRLQSAKDGGVLRQLSAIFDTRSLGYSSSLVAARIADEEVDAAAQRLNAHPGISHNYKRNHEFNLWYTVAVPPDSSFEDHLDALHEISGSESTRVLPTLKLFKIGVKLDMTGERRSTAKEKVAAHEKRELPSEKPVIDARERDAIRALQEDLPLVAKPFEAAGEALGFSGGELVECAKSFVDRKLMRRFAAVMNHRSAGFKANAMGVWAVPEDVVEEIGPVMASFASVSHCYRRPTYEDWPYSVFTMIHGRNSDEIAEAVAAIEAETGISDHDLLWSVKEYKKVRVRYFTPDWDEWENENLS